MTSLHRLALVAAATGLLSTSLNGQSSSDYRTASTLTFDYEGYLLAFGFADFLGDGSTTMIAGGFRFPNEDKGLPIKAINISRTGQLSDVTARLIDGSPTQVHARRGVVADFNADGRPDYFSASHGYDIAPFDGDYQVLLLSQPDGRLKDESATLRPQVKQFVHSAAAADLKGTGRPDLFIGVTFAKVEEGLEPEYYAPAPQPRYLGAYMLRNDGSGHFSFDNKTLPSKVTFSFNTSTNPWIPWDSPGYIVWEEFADLNNDDRPDLILASGSRDSNVAGSVYFNDGDGGFKTTEFKLPVGLFGEKNTSTYSILPVDLDRDGLRDLILDQVESRNFSGTRVQVLMNKGGGLFVDETNNRIPGQTGVGSPGYGLYSVDIDGDGALDIYHMLNYPTQTQSMAFKNDGRGNFTPFPVSALPPIQNNQWMLPVDFNRDGKPDFVGISSSRNRITLTLNENVRR